MRDAIGNKISEGSLLVWHPNLDHLKTGIIVNVAHVTDGGLSLADTKQLTPAMLVIQIPIPVNNIDPGKEAQVGEFLCVVNPQAEAAIEKMIAGQRKQ
jgi:hypothetical protein